MARIPLGYFQHIFIINLKTRTDRKRQTIAEFGRSGLDAERITWFDAHRPDAAYPFESAGAHGCFMSHLGILETATAKGLKRIAILEDDVEFVRNPSSRLLSVEDALANRPWDFFYGGSIANRKEKITEDIAAIQYDEPVMLTHFVALQGAAIESVAKHIRAQLGRPPGSPEGGPMHVDGSYTWARRELRLDTLIANPPLCRQRSSRSDIAPPASWEGNPLLRAAGGALRSVKRVVSGMMRR